MSEHDNATLGSPARDVEFRVLVRGLKLDETTRALIDAAIRSAVLREVGTVDGGVPRRLLAPNEDAQTRGLTSSKVLGLVLRSTTVA